MASNPTQRTLAALRAQGIICQVVERWQAFGGKPGGVRIDLFGFIDIVAISQGIGIIGIQCTSGSNAAARVAKIRGECVEQARAWLLAGGKVEVWGWRKVAIIRKDGTKGKARTWQPRIQAVTLADF